jgi:DNA-binding LytR/AlgR family response regulator
MLKIYIVEDMAITRASLESNLENNGYQVVGSSANAEGAWEEIRHMDGLGMVLLDINLAGEKDGIWLGAKIKAELDVPFIFLTAYGDDETLQEVIDSQANGYLMKPYNIPTLLATISLAKQNYEEYKVKQNHTVEPISAQNDVIYIKDSHIRVKLKISDINYIQSDGNYLKIYLPKKRHVIRSKMVDFLNKMNSDLFLRIHQRYAVNISRIEQVGANHVTVGIEDIPVKGKYKKELLERLNIN